jgi:hypothetical protein
MKKLFVLSIVVCMTGACAAYMDQAPKATAPNESAYLEKATSMPLNFTVPKEKAEEVWSRINVFISKYSSMKIQVATAYNVETFNLPDCIHYGYSASKLQKGDGFEFTVVCLDGCSFGSQKNRPAQNAHVLAYYALTGEIMERFIAR